MSLLNLPCYNHFSCLENFRRLFWKVMIFAVMTLFFWRSDIMFLSYVLHLWYYSRDKAHNFECTGSHITILSYYHKIVSQVTVKLYWHVIFCDSVRAVVYMNSTLFYQFLGLVHTLHFYRCVFIIPYCNVWSLLKKFLDYVSVCTIWQHWCMAIHTPCSYISLV